MIPKLFHCLLLFFFREKEIAEMLVQIVSTAPTKRNSTPGQITQQQRDDCYTSNGDATNRRFHLVREHFRNLQYNKRPPQTNHRIPIAALFYGHDVLTCVAKFQPPVV